MEAKSSPIIPTRCRKCNWIDSEPNEVEQRGTPAPNGQLPPICSPSPSSSSGGDTPGGSSDQNPFEPDSPITISSPEPYNNSTPYEPSPRNGSRHGSEQENIITLQYEGEDTS